MDDASGGSPRIPAVREYVEYTVRRKNWGYEDSVKAIAFDDFVKKSASFANAAYGNYAALLAGLHALSANSLRSRLKIDLLQVRHLLRCLKIS